MDQKIIFFTELQDGKVVYELEPNGTENLYSQLPFDEMKTLGLRNAFGVGPEFSIVMDISNGIFRYSNEKGVEIIPAAYNGITLTGRECKYNFFQYKQAHGNFIPGSPVLENVIDKHVIGWEMEYDSHTYRFECSVKPDIMMPEMNLIVT